jgi:uncharacterized membrane protein YqiK
MLWTVAEPNEALIISGLRGGKSDSLGFKIVTGGGTFVFPIAQKVRKLSLGLREASLSTDCVTQQGIPVGIRGVAIFKISDDSVSIANAARRFLDEDDEMITRNIQNLFDGHLRSIIGGMTIEGLIRERDSLTSETRKTAGEDMIKLGFIIDSLQIKEIIDPSGYIKNLAAPHVADVTKNARIAAANADLEATQREQEAAANKAASIRDSEIKRAGFQAEVDKAKAEAAQAGPLAQATAMQNVTRAETTTAELNAALAEQNLQATVRKPADAAAYAVKVEAQAARDAAINHAEAEAKRVELEATAKANAVRITGEAQASATTVNGEADGSAKRAVLLAEADGIKARAEALALNQDAVIGQLLAEKMPEIVRAAASAYSNVKELMVLDGADGIARGIGTFAGLATTLLPAIRGAVGAMKNAVSTPPDSGLVSP